MEVVVQEGALRQVVSAALKSSMPMPVAAWSTEFVEEAVLAELTSSNSTNSSSNSSSSSSDTAVNNNSNSTGHADTTEAAAVQAASDQVALASSVLDLIQQYHEATEALHSSSSSSDSARMPTAKAPSNRSGSGSKRSKAAVRQQETVAGSADSSNGQVAEFAGVIEQLQSMFWEVLQDNYQQVEAADVSAFGLKLLHELSQLVEAALAAQQGDEEGLCQLCEREMPLTKHHLIPRDVHKDFKKRGFGFAELQLGLMVCRPCHSAIHRAVPDNKELALHYRTLDTLRQHKDIANFASWARRQRVTNKADVSSAHFRYRR